MAEALAPVATTAIDYKRSPTVDPPPTTFPYPKRQHSEGEQTQVDSDDATLYDAANSRKNSEPPLSDKVAIEDGALQRPVLAPHKFETEISRPVGKRARVPIRQHRSNINERIARDSEDAAVSSQSEGSSSSDDESVSELRRHRSQTSPNDKPLAKSHLNRSRVTKRPSNLRVGNQFFQSKSRIARDGRLNISVSEKAETGYLAKALGATIERQLGTHHTQDVKDEEQAKDDFLQVKEKVQIPQLNIVIMVIGSRGDIQPFLKIGKILQDKYNHRVRIASHPAFKKFVEEDVGLEFFSVGGDPAELMSFMVKNPGLIPSLETVKAGEIGRRRESMYQMFQGFWRACINATDDETDTANLKMMGSKPPFVADAIIANPPSFAHYHCAERLSIPLHLVFTFPYSPTQAFPHPLANIKSTNVDQSYVNFMSYPLVDLMTWQGLGDLVNRFRVKTLGLEPVSTLWAPGQLSRLRVPMTYLWSPGLVPKPADWGPEIDIAGYVFLDLASSYKPPADLAKFLDRSGQDKRPILYIGFGSISGIEDPAGFCRMIFDAVEKANVRALISRGWGGMGDGMDKPDGVFMIDNVPHDWLFPKVDAVVHHGGAGTTAAGLRFGKPTMIVPFFGDQPFWSAMVARAGAGAKEALPLKKLDADRFAESIRQCLEPDARAKAEEIARSIQEEGDGAENAVDSFHRALPLDGPHSIRCNIMPDRVAVWKVKHAHTQLSPLAADLLVENRELLYSDLELKKIREWNDFQGPGEPITGAGGAVVQAFQEAVHGLTEMTDETKRDLKKFEKRRQKHKEKSIVQGLILPGKMAYATRGTSVEEQRKEHARLEAQLKLQGEAEPARFPFAPSRPDQDPDQDGSTNLSRVTTCSSTGGQPAAVVVIKDIGKGIGHSAHAILALPFRMWNATTLGFHNAPRLYGDATVRPAPDKKITGLRSGMKAAVTECWLGLYDGVIGVVRLPILEVHDEGWKGLPKGCAKGFGGLVLKPIAGSLGLGAYTFKGIHHSIRRRVRDTEKTDRWIRRARIAQGQRDAAIVKGQKRMKDQPPNPSQQHSEIDELRDHALRQWTTIEKDKVIEGRERERRNPLLNLAPQNGGKNNKKISRAKTVQ
ncbi:hypothetical protein LTR99_006483 [Exophiala xenobiotica]|uniref:Glycosyltransferase family 28 N-terminal domain-containing protein n=1 Tax=Vermiconidia calcicola TaxID=1690605 RepID=A0AAV9QBF1_9PEZI|nr:hypothetical protein LTR96_007329 [Exophiala xenobiotica]KAK5536972.1 hypothetical protein LTR23_007820 [Chaetothyriales sp. CCFEE 6169]KAK5537653.1 hypothetical protein LTR25_004905 [Vermiconidia calcicola]KAK5301516.1 hypothetical protein LTR99_006483 [Exophiala xenobiotica]KAK5335035.1 hypothetical protein LTR98_008755 [Exophiala xenobiotica]